MNTTLVTVATVTSGRRLLGVRVDAEMRDRYGPAHAYLPPRGVGVEHDAELAIEMADNACPLGRDAADAPVNAQ